MTESLHALATKQLEVEDIDRFMIIMDQRPGNCASPGTDHIMNHFKYLWVDGSESCDEASVEGS